MVPEEPKLLVCDEHGEQYRAYICRHLFNDGRRHAIGLFEADERDDESPEDRTAWCKACDDVLAREGEWNDCATAFADPAVVCAQCFEQILEAQLRLNPIQVLLNDNDI